MAARGRFAMVTDGRRTQTAPADGTPQARTPGTVLAGKYRLEHVLGRGGMGVVYSARHLSLDEPVALKLLSTEVATRSDSVARFLREARACVRLRNPHVVRVMDAGTLEDGTPYVAMEKLEGSDLGTLIDERGPLPIPEAVELVLQACEALAEAHARGIVHRDIKPSNLWLVRDPDCIKVLDFGIAKMTDPEAPTSSANTLTASTTVLGSPAYMAPEQIRHAGNVDARTDIWALGVVLFELVSGELPFQGDSATGLLAAICADPPLTLRRVLPGAPPAFERVIASCLERDRERRPKDVAELARRLTPFRLPIKPRRNRRWVLGAAALGLLGAGALVLSMQPTVHARLGAGAVPIAQRVHDIPRVPAPDKNPPPARQAQQIPVPVSHPAPARPARRASTPKRDPFEASLESATAQRK